MNKINSRYRHTRLDNTGAALIITLLLLSLLTGLVVEFAYGVYIGTASLSNWGDAQKASLVAKSGQSLSSLYMNEFRNASYTSQDEVLLPVEFDFGPGTTLSVHLEDENAKFNINSIIFENGRTNEDALTILKRLFEYLELDPALTLSIADWIDPNSEPQIGDSELNAKNAPLWDIGEMHYINGMDDEIFAAISPFLTVHGDNLININTAALPVLVSLDEKMTGELAENIIHYREHTHFEDIQDILQVSGLQSIGALLHGRITVQSKHFRVVSRADVSGTVRTIESVLDTSMKVHYWREG